MIKTLIYVYILIAYTGQALAYHEVIPNCYLNFTPKYTNQIQFNHNTELTVMSYNTLNLKRQIGKYVNTDSGGRVFKQINEQKPEWQTTWIARIIKKENPDILFLQEVEGRQVAYDFNRKYLNSEYQIFYTGGNDPRGINIAILMHKRLPFQYEIHSHRKLKMTDPTPGQKRKKVDHFSRDFPFILVKDQKKKPIMLLGGVHLKSQRPRGSDGNSFHLRSAQMKNTIKVVDDYIREYDDLPMIVAGDFNADLRKAPEFKSLRRGNILKDSFDSVPTPLPQEQRITHTFHPKKGKTNHNQLDGIFQRNMQVLRTRVHRYRDQATGVEKKLPTSWDERNKNPSDHFPIISVMKLDK